MLKLLGRQTSGNVQKVLFGLEEMGVPYAREDYGRQFGNTATPEYKAMNPTAKVPTLVDGNVVIWESHAILRYLADCHAPQLTGNSPALRSEVERWMDWLLASLNTPYVNVFKDARLKPEERSAGFAESAKTLASELSFLDGQIAGREWFALDRLTLADIALAPIVKRCLDFPIERAKLPAIESWMARIDERPAFKKATGGAA